ncbi:MAG: hypothetical protein AVDCRST_MAG49-2927, partial [uncultured Thermomicrobiales bacterium]
WTARRTIERLNRPGARRIVAQSLPRPAGGCRSRSRERAAEGQRPIPNPG